MLWNASFFTLALILAINTSFEYYSMRKTEFFKDNTAFYDLRMYWSFCDIVSDSIGNSIFQVQKMNAWLSH